MPLVGLGTWLSKPDEVRKAVKYALETGYRHLDCAYVYCNEDEVGQGIRDSGVPRSEIFITSKVISKCIHTHKKRGTNHRFVYRSGTLTIVRNMSRQTFKPLSRPLVPITSIFT